jgi:hypothetical protein
MKTKWNRKNTQSQQLENKTDISHQKENWGRKRILISNINTMTDFLRKSM